MSKYIFLLILFFCVNRVSSAQNRRGVKVCELYGSVFIEKNRSFADFAVFLESSEAFADLLVFKQPNRIFADRSGQWFLCPSPIQANFKIFIVDKKAFSDFSIYYIQTESFAGCQ